MSEQTKHIVMDGPDLVCRHCGKRDANVERFDVVKLMATMRAFIRTHRACLAPGGAA